MVSFLFRVIDSTSDQIEDKIGYRSSRQRSGLPRIPSDREMSYIQQHVAHFDHSDSPFISTTTSFLWALWEAGRRKNMKRRKKDIRIMVINQDAINPPHVHNIHQGDYLSELSSMDKTCGYFARRSSEVLIKHRIPEGAILATITWEGIRSYLRDTPLHLGFMRLEKDEALVREYGKWGSYERRLQSWRAGFARDEHAAKSSLGKQIRAICRRGVESAHARRGWTEEGYKQLVKDIFSELQ